MPYGDAFPKLQNCSTVRIHYFANVVTFLLLFCIIVVISTDIDSITKQIGETVVFEWYLRTGGKEVIKFWKTSPQKTLIATIQSGDPLIDSDYNKRLIMSRVKGKHKETIKVTLSNLVISDANGYGIDVDNGNQMWTIYLLVKGL